MAFVSRAMGKRSKAMGGDAIQKGFEMMDEEKKRKKKEMEDEDRADREDERNSLLGQILTRVKANELKKKSKKVSTGDETQKRQRAMDMA